LKKLLSARDPGRALLWMRTSGVLTEILPESEKWGIDAIPGLIAAEQTFRWQPDPLLRLASIVPPDTERLEGMAKRLRLSKAEAAYFTAWTKAPRLSAEIADTAFDRLLYRNGEKGLATALRLSLASSRQKSENDPSQLPETARLQRLLTRAEKWQKPVFPLTGADVLAAGVVAGPRVGDILSQLEDKWVDGNFNADRATLVARLQAIAKTDG
jgi:poly(A) polymerase